MSSSPDHSGSSLRTVAASWTVRRDRGLSASESIEYELWLAADPRHAQAMALSAAAWMVLDRIPESSAAAVLAMAARKRSFWRRTITMTSVAAAAAIVLGVVTWSRREPAQASGPRSAFSSFDSPRTVTLSDGSTVQLNSGSEVVEQFTPTERRVLLIRGEAHFGVTKNPARPFVVRAGGLAVHAVGTAFDVNLRSATVDVIVTEGRVQLSRAAATVPGPALDAGERAVLRGALPTSADLADALIRSHLDAAGMADALAWREPLLRLGGATLAELATEFERGTGRRLVFADPSLAELRFGGRFRADDIDGFTQVLAATLDLTVEHAANGSIVLRKKSSLSR